MRQASRHNSVAGMKFCDYLDLFLRVARIPFHHDLSDCRPRPWFDLKSEINLVLLGEAMLRDSELRTVESVVIEYPLQVRARPLELVRRIEFP
jgi:hypothetical protein